MILNQGANNFLRPGLFRQAVVHIGRRVSSNAGIEQTLSKEPLLQMDRITPLNYLLTPLILVHYDNRGNSIRPKP